MQVANVKLRQILPRVGKIWVCTPQNRTYRAWRTAKLTPMVRFQTAPTGSGENMELPIYFLIVKPIVNCALSNSLNAYDRHSDWHKLEVCGTKMSIYF